MFKVRKIDVKHQASINLIQRADTPVHDWYQFVLGYPPHLVRQYIEKFHLERCDLLCDPFCGTGTTLVEAKKCGICSVGCDAHPFAALVSRVKTNWTLDLTLVAALLRRIVASSELEMPPLNLPAMPLFKTNSEEAGNHNRKKYSLSRDEEKLLPTGFLSERPLQRLLILRDAIEEVTDGHPSEVREFFLVATAHVIANGAGNFAFGPEIYLTKPKLDYDVLAHFQVHARRMLSEMGLARMGTNEKTTAEVFLDDARSLNRIPSGLAGVITSPPYPNEKDYTRTTRVESILLGLLKNRKELRTV